MNQCGRAERDLAFTTVFDFSPVASVIRYLNLYRQTAERLHGYVASSEQIGWAAPIYIAETDERARAESKIHIERLFSKYLNLPFEMMFPPGYLSAGSLKAMRAVKRPALAAGTMTIDNLIDAGIFLCGSPDTVRGKLVEAHHRLGFQNFLANLHFATLPRDLTEKNLRLFATEVMPTLQKLSDKEYAGMETQAAE